MPAPEPTPAITGRTYRSTLRLSLGSKEAIVGTWLCFLSKQSAEISIVEISSDRRRTHFSVRYTALRQCSTAGLTVAPGRISPV